MVYSVGNRVDGNSTGIMVEIVRRSGITTGIVDDIVNIVGCRVICCVAKNTPPSPLPDASCEPLTDSCRCISSAMRVGRIMMSTPSTLKSNISALIILCERYLVFVLFVCQCVLHFTKQTPSTGYDESYGSQLT